MEMNLGEMVGGEELAQDEIQELISEYVEIDLEERKIEYKDSFNELDPGPKQLVILLSVALLQKQEVIEATSMDPVELAELIEVEVGESYPALRELEQRGLVENVGRKYKVALEKKEDIEAALEDEQPAE